ncbi:uridylate kinase [Methylophilales bacterium MBRSG12]|jgi:uridylate kinase|uniref:Uridylate kinase n=1 Tax=Methylophilales bacterium MBRS-H7 TaxID=1623450 RepID=A0A0H4JD36_9PROT|nr:uridylate kinase [Methylophilales bacterium MBRSF5]AKO66392.1 uridylate kinase [Methylophilales bacterium MBRS-H7]AKO67707.1 uridylate kinase [Methylophilales bacterium MBRSG12]
MLNKPIKRVLLKLSGEALMGENSFGISPDIVNQIVIEIKKILEQDIQLAIVIGGGNIFRGISLGDQGMTRATGDYMGMLATVMNSLALEDAFNKNNIITRVQSAVNVEQIVEPYVRAKALQYLSENKVVIFSGGTGNPFFTTDTAAALRASEIDADIMIKATKVNGIYSDDPVKNQKAVKFDQISFDDVIDKKLKVMDATAFTLCREQSMPIGVINIFKQNSLYNFINKNFTDGTLVIN